MSQAHFYGPCTGPEGYSEVTRGLVYALDDMGWNIAMTPFPGWGPWTVRPAPHIKRTLDRCLNTTIHPQTSPVPQVHVCLPEQVNVVENRLNVNVTMFEADRIPKNWVECLRVLDRVVVPSESSRRSFMQSGVPEAKIRIMPLGHDPEVFHPGVEPLNLICGGLPLLDKFPIRIMSILEVTNRKNFEGLLLAFFRAAAILGPEHCCLILKAANYSTFLPIDQKIRSLRNRMVRTGMIPDKEYHVFNHAPLIPGEEMGAFMAVATHYLSCSYAEGWDLNAHNAMALGVPVIVPDHSGYQGYCNRSNACMLPISKRIVAAQDPQIARLYHGAAWFGTCSEESPNILANYLADPVESKIRSAQALLDAESLTWHCAANRLAPLLAP
jgi:glycosyltransferase involved in cell wall biosynthesis